MSEAHIFVIGILLAWMAGIRVYLTVFGVGLAGALGWLDLPPALQVTESWWVLGTSGALAITEFFADKIPGVDSGWDLLQTLARVPAGAFLAAATLSSDGQLSGTALAAGAGIAMIAPNIFGTSSGGWRWEGPFYAAQAVAQGIATHLRGTAADLGRTEQFNRRAQEWAHGT